MNAADLARRHDHNVGLRRGQELLRLLLPFKIDLVVAGGDDLTCRVRETAHDRGADHALMTGDINPPAGEIEYPVGHQTPRPRLASAGLCELPHDPAITLPPLFIRFLDN